MSTGTTTSAGRPVITAWSAVSPYGLGREAFAEGIRARAATAVKLDPEQWHVPLDEACLVPDFDVREVLGKKGTSKMDRLTGLALATTARLLYDADGVKTVETDDRTGFVLGTAMGSVQSMVDFTRDSLVNERPFYVDAGRMPNGVLNCAAGRCAIWHDLKGPNTTLAGGRISGLLALNYARRLLRLGRASQYICGSAEEFTPVHAWFEHHRRDEGAPAPLLGEGCGLLLVEDAETTERPALAEILAIETAVVLDGDVHDAVTRCVRRALDRADAPADEVWAACPSAAPGDLGRAEHEALAALVPAAALARVPGIDLMGDTSAATATFQIGAVLGVAETEPAARGRLALITAADPDGGVACALLRLGGAGE